ncbi:MAG: DUF5009 domain-containing protein [Candidatus Omnitrophica bacterium]|nr:DUF5009 domain-containing protein [Candidatus Omnitrophota bacterium]
MTEEIQNLPATPVSKSLDPRVLSLDQFRGYTMAGMFLVNFIGEFAAIPEIFKHNNTYCSYADTIFPHFFFAVGFAYRLAFLKRLKRAESSWPVYRHAIWRCLGLILIGLIIYHLGGRYRSWEDLRETGVGEVLYRGFRSLPWQALVHIGVTSLFVLPVIHRSKAVRISFMVASAGLHVFLSHLFYYDWVIENRSIDGGPLGFLTYTVPTIVGSLAYDLMTSKGPKRSLSPLLLWGAVLMTMGYAFSCITTLQLSPEEEMGFLSRLANPPFMPPTYPTDMWTMNQQVGSLSYLVFASGFSLWVYALFVIVSDLKRFEVGMFRTFGTNALAGYIIHDMVLNAIHPLAPYDSPLTYIAPAFALYFGITYFFIRHLEKKNIYFKL